MLSQDFFARNVVAVAKDLIGAVLRVDGVGGPIVEVEAYDGQDPASHSFRGPTARNGPMFGPAGHAYVYRIYGMHWCLNFVCEPGSAVLIRALEPVYGVDLMQERRGARKLQLLCSGPGRLCQALAVSRTQDALPLDAAPFRIDLPGDAPGMAVGPRIGITKGVETPWRFGLAGSRFLSRPFRA